MAATALITGATGLIGAAVLDGWDLPDLEPVVGDHDRDNLLVPGTPTALVRRLRPSVVIHLAWVASGTAGYRTSPDNARWLSSTLELAEACREQDALLFATGTGLDRYPGARDPYSSAKSGLWEALAPAVADGHLGWLRPFYVVDPVRRRPALIEQALAALAADEPLTVLTPDSAHDFVHVADVGSAVRLAARERLSGEVELGSGRLRPVRALVEALGVEWKPGPTPSTPPPHVHSAADVTRLRDLGWSPIRTEELFSGD
jgi:nucleoside-diphosphate-sugar epimerase